MCSRENSLTPTISSFFTFIPIHSPAYLFSLCPLITLLIRFPLDNRSLHRFSVTTQHIHLNTRPWFVRFSYSPPDFSTPVRRVSSSAAAAVSLKKKNILYFFILIQSKRGYVIRLVCVTESLISHTLYLARRTNWIRRQVLCSVYVPGARVQLSRDVPLLKPNRWDSYGPSYTFPVTLIGSPAKFIKPVAGNIRPPCTAEHRYLHNALNNTIRCVLMDVFPVFQL